MAEPGEYPKAAYRLGSEMEIWGRMMDYRVLTDADDEAGALMDGWALHPLDVGEALTAETIDPERPRRGRPPKVRIEDSGVTQLS